MKLYGDISKTEQQDDGTVKVWGYASSSAVDSDGETVTAEAMKAAIPDYMKFGAVREMHQAKAAGTAIEAEVQEDGRTYFGAHIVDSEAVKKVNAGVYKGFSIGGKVTGRDELKKTTVTGLKLVEVSLVDRPANPEAMITIVKIEDAEDHDLKKYAGESISDTRRAASALDDIYYLFLKESQEAEDYPDQVAALKSVIDGLKVFIASEIQEPDDDPAAASDMFSYAATTDDIRKAGAEISAKNKATAQAIHDHAVSLGASCSPDTEKSEGSDDLQKVQSENDDLKKQFQDLDTAHTDLKKTLHETTLELEKIKAEPVPVKVSLNEKGITVTKSADGAADDSDLSDEVFVKDAKGNINEAATLIKLSHMSGGLSRH
jgi:phage head maturation protease